MHSKATPPDVKAAREAARIAAYQAAAHAHDVTLAELRQLALEQRKLRAIRRSIDRQREAHERKTTHTGPRKKYQTSNHRRAGAMLARREPVASLDVFQRDDWLCYLCGKRVHLPSVPGPVATQATVDHIVPLSLGGEHTMLNVKTCCSACNVAKGNRADAVDIRVLLELL